MVRSLRPWLTSDLPRLALLANNLNIASNMTDAFPHPYRLEHAQAYFEQVVRVENGNIIRAICLNNKLVGSVGLHPKKDIHRHEMEVGYWVGEPYWRQGLASWAVHQMIKIGFAQPGIVRLYAEIMSHNTGSARVLEKAGFQLEGRLRKGMIKNGEYVDALRYGLLSPDM